MDWVYQVLRSRRRKEADRFGTLRLLTSAATLIAWTGATAESLRLPTANRALF